VELGAIVKSIGEGRWNGGPRVVVDAAEGEYPSCDLKIDLADCWNE